MTSKGERDVRIREVTLGDLSFVWGSEVKEKISTVKGPGSGVKGQINIPAYGSKKFKVFPNFQKLKFKTISTKIYMCFFWKVKHVLRMCKVNNDWWLMDRYSVHTSKEANIAKSFRCWYTTFQPSCKTSWKDFGCQRKA